MEHVGRDEDPAAVHAGARPGVALCHTCGRLVIRGRGRWWEWTRTERAVAMSEAALKAVMDGREVR